MPTARLRIVAALVSAGIACSAGSRHAASNDASGGAIDAAGQATGAPVDGGTGAGSTPVEASTADMADAHMTAVADAISTDDTAAAACPSLLLTAGDYIQTLTLDGGLRTFTLHVPPGLDPSKPAPLVFAFHGGGQNAWQFEGFSHIRTKSNGSGFVLVEAEGSSALGPSPTPPPPDDAGIVLEVWNAGNCCEYASQLSGNIDDVGFVRAMIDSIEKQICIDPKRIYATGFSNGAMLSHRLACQLSDRIASIVAVSGGSGATNYDQAPPQTLFDCHPGRPVPVLHIHGTQDACYPFDGGWGPLSLVTFEPVMVTIQDWVGRNGCEAGSPAHVFQNGTASCGLYPCAKQGEVELCIIDGGGHYWPGGDDWPGSTVYCGSGQGARSADIVANDAMWTWFTDHPMP